MITNETCDDNSRPDSYKKLKRETSEFFSVLVAFRGMAIDPDDLSQSPL